MFCGKCGAPNSGTTGPCCKCGTPLMVPPSGSLLHFSAEFRAQGGSAVYPRTFAPVSYAGQSVPPSRSAAPAPSVRKPSRGRTVWLIFCLAVLMVAAAVFFLLMIMDDGNSPEKEAAETAQQLAQLLENAPHSIDADEVLELIPTEVEDYLLERQGISRAEFDENAAQWSEDLQAYIAQTYGEDCACTIDGMSSLGEEDTKRIRELYKEEIPGLSIDNAVDVSLTIEGNKTLTPTIHLIEADGQWYVDVLSLMQMAEPMNFHLAAAQE